MSFFKIILALGGIYLIKTILIEDYFVFLLLFVEYLAWFIGWNYALLYQLSALTVVDAWSKYVVDLINLLSDYNVTKSVVEAVCCKKVEKPKTRKIEISKKIRCSNG